MYENDFDEIFTDETLQNGLHALMLGECSDDEICWEKFRISTFEEAGVMTHDKGLVIHLPDGSEYQLTIIQSR